MNWYGLIAPKGTPTAIIERLSGETAKAMRSPGMAKRLIAEGSEAVGSSAREFAAHIRAERTQWEKVIKQAGIKGE